MDSAAELHGDHDLTDVPSGVYVFIVNTSEGLVSTKIIKK